MEDAEGAKLKGYDKMNDIPADLIYHPNELDKWLDETSAPLSDDEMCDMFNLSAEEHPELFLPREISSLEVQMVI